MNLLRGLLLDNLGIKLVALLLALVVYLHVFTERPATMVVSFPIQLADLPDSLSLSGTVPAGVKAELKGTGKQFIRLWLSEPRLMVSLAGVGPGRIRRVVTRDDLPLVASDGLDVTHLIGPDTLDIHIERKLERRVAVAPRVEGTPGSGASWDGLVIAEPAAIVISGPKKAVSAIDSVRLQVVQIDGQRDTVRTEVKPLALPSWCSANPPAVAVTVPISRPRP